ncbi:MAG TPA: hypothetical protein VIO16_12840 [Dehalococcoidia bacterium]
MIEPTVGRLVHYFFAGDAVEHAALVVGIHNERSINLAVFNNDGSLYPALEVQLLQDDDAKPEGPHAAWMPFQKGQATKTEQTEAGLLPRLEALEQLLTAGGPIHTLVDDLTKGVDGKFQALGDWLTPALDGLKNRLDAMTAPDAKTAFVAEVGPGASAGTEGQKTVDPEIAAAGTQGAAEAQATT